MGQSLSYHLNVTTVYSPPASCATGITLPYGNATYLWNNVVVPTPNVTATNCLPSQFYSSAAATISLPPFKQLICPATWGTYQVNSTYIICCPAGFGLYAPNITYSVRPALSAVCTSIVWPGIPYDVTSYITSGNTTVMPLTAGVNGTIVLATAFDGTVATTTMNVTSTTTHPATTIPPSTSFNGSTGTQTTSIPLSTLP